MAKMKNNPIREVLDNYKLDVVSIDIISDKDKKGAWGIKASQGDFILKRVACSESTLKYLLSCIYYLSKNGVLIPQIFKTSDGNGYVNVDKVCYILSQRIRGEKPNYGSYNDLEIILRELGYFHLASKGYTIPENVKIKIHLGTWIDEYNKYLEEMNDYFMRLKAGEELTKVEKLIVEEFPYFYMRGKDAIRKLNGPEYWEWVQKVELEGALCHQDFSSANLILSSGKIYVFDMDSIAIDIPARDLRKLFNKVMKKIGKWDMDLLGRMMYWYSFENPLSPQEWRVVKYDLVFPHLFLGMMSKYSCKREMGWSEIQYYQRFRDIIAFEKTIIHIIKGFDSVIPLKKNI